MTPKTRKQYVEELLAQVMESIKDHVILDTLSSVQDHNRNRVMVWTLRNPNGCSNFKVQIVASAPFGSLVVFGDIDPVMFSYCSPFSYEGAVRWISNGSIDYVLQKASIGTGHEVARSWDPEVALDDATGYLCDGLHDQVCEEEDIEATVKDIELWRSVIEAIERGEPEREIEMILAEAGENEAEIGVVPSTRVIQAWAMCKKLDELLKEMGD